MRYNYYKVILSCLHGTVYKYLGLSMARIEMDCKIPVACLCFRFKLKNKLLVTCRVYKD